jgi:uncharacterized membrane protein
MRRRPLGRSIRDITLACAALTTGLMAGVFYAYAVSVNLGLAEQPDASYVATMNEINEKIQNPLFFPGFFGAVVFPIAAAVAHLPNRRSGRFRLIVLACALYGGGGFLVTVLANVPLNEELARVAADASPDDLARARAAYEGSWNFWNGVRTVSSTLAFLALIGSCLSGAERGTQRVDTPGR